MEPKNKKSQSGEPEKFGLSPGLIENLSKLMKMGPQTAKAIEQLTRANELRRKRFEQMSPQFSDSLLNIGKAARFCGVHTDTLRLWEKQGKIDSVRTKGGHRRYKLGELVSRAGTNGEISLSECADIMVHCIEMLNKVLIYLKSQEDGQNEKDMSDL